MSRKSGLRKQGRFDIRQAVASQVSEDEKAGSYLDSLSSGFDSTWEETFKKIYVECESATDIASVSETIPYPPELVSRMRDENVKRVFIGALPRFELIYCIIDATITFWNCYDQELQTISEFTDGCIAGITSGNRMKEIYKKSVEGVVCYTTLRTLKIIPVVKRKLDLNSILAINLQGTDCDLLTITEDGDIYIANTSNVYRVVLTKKDKVITGTLQIFPKYWYQFSILEPYFPGVLEICYIEHLRVLALLRTQRSVMFYSLEDKENPQILCVLDLPSWELRHLCPVCYNSSICLIAFGECGERILISEYSLRVNYYNGVRFMPSLFVDQGLVSSEETLTGGLFLYERGVVITKMEKVPKLGEDLVEAYVKFDFGDEEVLHFARERQSKFRCSPVLSTDLMWQHVLTPDKGYLLTAKGIKVVEFYAPFDRLKRYLKEKGNCQKQFQTWQISIGYSEVVATALILISKEPNMKKEVINLLAEIQTKRVESAKEPHKRSFITDGFVIRISRLLTPVWYERIIKEVNGRYKIDIFENMPQFIHRDLEALIEVGNALLPNMQEEDESDHLKIILQNIVSYAMDLLEEITFLEMCRTLKSAEINDAFEKLEEEYQWQLQDMMFCTLDVRVIKSFALHAFQYFDQSCQKKIQSSCSTLFSQNELLMSQLVKGLETETTEIHLSTVVSQICQIITENSDLVSACRILLDKKHWKGVVSLCVRKAEVVDPGFIALGWYKGKADDDFGAQFFDKVYECYEPVLVNISDCIDAVTETSHELLHLLSYYQLDKEVGDMEKLVSIKSPFIESYIREERPLLLWEYFRMSSDYASAAVSLMKAVDDCDELSIEDRAQMLPRVVALASELPKFKRSAKTKLRLAEVQVQMKSRASGLRKYDGVFDTVLLDADSLFAHCLTLGYFDLAIILATICDLSSGSREHLMSLLWAKMFAQQLKVCDFVFVRTFLSSLICQIGHITVDLYELVLFMENYRLNKRGDPQWTFDTLKDAGFSVNMIRETYERILKRSDVTGDWRADLLSVL